MQKSSQKIRKPINIKINQLKHVHDIVFKKDTQNCHNAPEN